MWDFARFRRVHIRLCLLGVFGSYAIPSYLAIPSYTWLTLRVWVPALCAFSSRVPYPLHVLSKRVSDSSHGGCGVNGVCCGVCGLNMGKGNYPPIPPRTPYQPPIVYTKYIVSTKRGYHVHTISLSSGEPHSGCASLSGKTLGQPLRHSFP